MQIIDLNYTVKNSMLFDLLLSASQSFIQNYSLEFKSIHIQIIEYKHCDFRSNISTTVHILQPTMYKKGNKKEQ
jgi:hypothetical protein